MGPTVQTPASYFPFQIWNSELQWNLDYSKSKIRTIERKFRIRNPKNFRFRPFLNIFYKKEYMWIEKSRSFKNLLHTKKIK